MMPNQSESEYRGWKIKIREVDNRPSIQVWKPGQDPRKGGDVVVPFIVHAVSRADARVAAPPGRGEVDRSMGSAAPGGDAMTQVARRASLVVLLLLASVGTASAECAWVFVGG
jgi:hypothetical protein